MSRSKTTTTLLVAALALACLAVDARAQSIGSIIGDTVDYFVDGVDARTFFNPSAGRCRNRPAQTPRNLQARATNPTTVQLTWRANGNSCVDFYEVTYSIEGVAQARSFAPLKVKDFVVVIPNLEPGARYVFNVRAVNERNGSSSTASTRLTMPSPARCQGAPRAPMNVRTRSDSPTTLTVAWESQVNDPCIERFEVTYVLESQTVTPRSLQPLYVTTNTVTLSGLQPASSYRIVVAAVGKNGQRSTVTTTGRTQPNCSPLRAPAATQARQVGARAVQLTWDNPQPSCIRNTQVSFVDKNSGSRGPVTTLGTADEQFTFANLQPGREYQFSVRYIGKDGSQSAPSSANVFVPNNSQGGTVVVPGRR